MTDSVHAAYREASLDLARAGLQEQGILRLRVISNSMLPTLRPGDEVIVQPASLGSLQRGDLVVVQHETELITHRLIEVSAQGWRTKGDHCTAADPVWPAAMILGRVVAIQRSGRSINLQTRRWQVLNRWLGYLNSLQATIQQRAQAARLHW